MVTEAHSPCSLTRPWHPSSFPLVFPPPPRGSIPTHLLPVRHRRHQHQHSCSGRASRAPGASFSSTCPSVDPPLLSTASGCPRCAAALAAVPLDRKPRRLPALSVLSFHRPWPPPRAAAAPSLPLPRAKSGAPRSAPRRRGHNTALRWGRRRRALLAVPRSILARGQRDGHAQQIRFWDGGTLL